MNFVCIFFYSIICSADSNVLVGGEWEGQILSARRPMVLFVNFSRRIARLDATGSQELPLQNLNARGAEIQFTIPIGDQKLEFAGTLIGGQISGTVAMENRVNFLLNRLPDWPAPASRVEAWRQDIEVLIDRFLAYDRSYAEAQKKEAIKILHDLETAVTEKTDEEIIVELSRAIARSGNAHTRLYLLRNRTELRRLPIRLWWFTDGLFVVKATPDYQDLLKCRVLRIGAHDPSKVREQVAELFAGNQFWKYYKSVYYMTSPEILRGLGLIPDMEKSEFTFQCQNRTTRRTIKPFSLVRKEKTTEAWWDLSPQWSEDIPMWVHSLTNPKMELPLSLRYPEQNYWFQVLESKRALYFQYNRSENRRGSETLKDFGNRLLEELNRASVSKMIVDLRWNSGGNLDIARDLMESLKKTAAEKDVTVYVLIGRATFSAGISHAVQWRESEHAVLVGEPCGDGLDFFSEGGNLILPNSKLRAHYANGFHSYSRREYPQFQPYFLDWNVDDLNPDVPVSVSSQQYFSGEDPLLSAVDAAQLQSFTTDDGGVRLANP